MSVSILHRAVKRELERRLLHLEKLEELVRSIQGALNTEETGEALIEVARNACRAEQELASLHREYDDGDQDQNLRKMTEGELLTGLQDLGLGVFPNQYPRLQAKHKHDWKPTDNDLIERCSICGEERGWGDH